MFARSIPLILVLVFCVCLAATASSYGLTEDSPKKEKKKAEQPAKISAALLQQRAKEPPSARVNGVKFDLSVTLRAEGKGSFLDLNWQITNVAARSPLVIVKPTLDVPTGSTHVLVWHVPKGSDYAYCNTFWSQFELLPPQPPFGIQAIRMDAEWYLLVPFGKSASARIEFPLKALKESLQNALPDLYNGRERPRLFVELWHCPFMSCEVFQLDTWTGRICLPPLEVPGNGDW